MLQKKDSEVSKSPTSHHDETHAQLTCAQPPNSGADCTFSTDSGNEVDETLSTSMLYHQPTPITDGAAHEHKELAPFGSAPHERRHDPVDDQCLSRAKMCDEHREFAPFGSAPHERRHDPVDDQCLSRAKMWDPVKDCSDPYTTQADVSSFLPDRHNSSQLNHSKTSASTSTGLHLPHSNHPYGQPRESPQRFMHLGPRGIGLPLHAQSHYTGLGYRGNASMDLLPFPQSQAMDAVCQFDASMNSQPIQVHNPHDQLQHHRQQRPVYEDILTLHPHLRDPSEHIGLQSATNGAALMDMQSHQAVRLHDHAQKNGQQDIGMESRMPTAIASHELVHPWQSPSSTIANMSTQKIPGFQSANDHQDQSFFPAMFQAMEMARNAEEVNQEFNREAAIHIYERACTFLQDVIIKSSSFQERRGCNAARKAYQARLDVLLRESAASPSNPPPEQNDQQEDDGLGGGKPQYSLYEDWALCRKVQEGLSWQEVASMPIFKDRRKHRSLSQRKHTIAKMGPKYHEPEAPWTERETRKLCALGDAGKSLGDIHRKFRSRNAERCLERYFHLKGYDSTSSSHAHTSDQARHAPPHNPETMQAPSFIARHSAYDVNPGTSIRETSSYGQSIDTALKQTNQLSAIFSQNIASAFTLPSQTSEASSPSSPFISAEPLSCSTASPFPNSGASPRPPATRCQGPLDSLAQQERQGAWYSTPPDSSAYSSAQDPEHRTVFLPPPSCNPSTLGTWSDNFSTRRASREALRNPSVEYPFGSWHPRLSMSSSSLSATTANSPTNPTSPTSSLSTPRTVTSPFVSRDSLDSHSVAARKVRKPE